ncbi:tetratricopeptide repeat protein [Bremerella cremea]|uniref:Tetratricopeptide repeat protein n=1 Tax=Bremerella cremea TaxID=1031537 RepID=A0A368KSI7_9BACT|nr:tetratricopeptide repeat protein [Bremerella cremea]RCS52630.1 tetratricopeptide repeat protein [Bremerella cremea]
MASLPTYRSISWLSVLPQMLIYVCVYLLVVFLTGSKDRGITIGIPIVLVYSMGSRYLVPHDHRRGLRLTSQSRFEEAIVAYQRSLEFFTKYSWIDRYRAFVLMSPSAISYREMDLCNIAYCHLQLGHTQEAAACYRQAIEMNPQNGLAIAGLRMIEMNMKS